MKKTNAPDKNEIRREARKRRAIERLGNSHPACAICGFNNPICLERHHIAGRKFAEETVIHCRNCHRIASDLQKDHPQPLPKTSSFEQIGHMLLGLSDFFSILAPKLKELGEFLISEAENEK